MINQSVLSKSAIQNLKKRFIESKGDVINICDVIYCAEQIKLAIKCNEAYAMRLAIELTHLPITEFEKWSKRNLI